MASRRAAMPFILATVLIDMIGFGIIVPVLPSLVTTMEGGSISEGSATFGWFVAIYALMQFIFSPMLGNLSDAIGRRPVILLSLFGAGLDYLLMAFAPNLTWLFIGRVISGITGANLPAANAYIADVSPPEQRARNFGLIGACFGVGFVLGPAVGGILGNFGLRLPFIAAACLTLLNALYGFFVLPESHPPDRRRNFDWRKANPLASLRVLGHYPVVLGLTASLVLASIAHQAFPATWVLYTKYRFQWNELQNGLSFAAVGIMAIVVQGGLVGTIISWIGEHRALILGMVISCVSFVLYGSANHGWMFYIIIVFGSIGAVSSPALQSIISRQIPLNEQGAVQGALASLQSLTGIVGPILVSHLFGFFISEAAPFKLPGAAFFFAAILDGVAILIVVPALRRPEFQESAVTTPSTNADPPISGH